MQRIKLTVIVGVGLIGGSFALAAKRAGLIERVVGVGRSNTNLARALELGIIDEISHDLAQASVNADLILVATPVGQMGEIFAQIAPVLTEKTIITDAGSTKCDVVQLMRQHFPHHLACCVPAHPIAGSDMSGAAAAQYGLYQKRKVVLTPLAQTSKLAVESISQLWRACGASIHLMSPEAHDASLAGVSHLPHLLSFAYMNMIANRPDAVSCLNLAGTGFRDFTRIAGSNAEMWRDICLANREALLNELNDYQQALNLLADKLTQSDEAGLSQTFEQAHFARVAWYQKFLQNN